MGAFGAAFWLVPLAAWCCRTGSAISAVSDYQVEGTIQKQGLCTLQAWHDAGTPLHAAARSNDTEAVQQLLASGATVDAVNGAGQTPLHVAAMCNSPAVAALLLGAGAAAGARDDQGRVPLHSAADFGSAACAALLLDSEGGLVDAQDDAGNTPLHLAASHGQLNVCEVLLDRGAGVNVKNKQGQAPLHQAAYLFDGHYPAIITLLHEHGAVVDAEDNIGRTPLFLADPSNVVALVKIGAKVNHRDLGGRSPLHWAAELNKVESVDTLVSLGADVEARDAEQRTPLHLTFRKDACGATVVLLQKGANLEARDQQGRTLLHLAALHHGHCTLGAALDNGADMNATDTEGETPLHCAAAGLDADSTVLLLAAGGVVSMQNKKGATPLHVSAERAYAPVAIELMDRGRAGVDTLDSEGRTAFRIAFDSNSTVGSKHEFLQALLSRGSSYDFKDIPGRISLLDLRKTVMWRIKVKGFLGIDVMRNININRWEAIHWASRFCDIVAAMRQVTFYKVPFDLRTTSGQTPADIAESEGVAPCEDLLHFFKMLQTSIEHTQRLTEMQAELQHHNAELMRVKEDLDQEIDKQVNISVHVDFSVGVIAACLTAGTIALQTLLVRLNTLTSTGFCGLVPGCLFVLASVVVWRTNINRKLVPYVAPVGCCLAGALILCAACAKLSRRFRKVLNSGKRLGASCGELFWPFVDLSVNVVMAVIVIGAELLASTLVDPVSLVAAMGLLAVNLSSLADGSLGRRHHSLWRGALGLGMLALAIARQAVVGPSPLRERPFVTPATVFMACAACVGAIVDVRRYAVDVFNLEQWVELGTVSEDKFVVGSFKMGQADQAAAGLVKTLGLSQQDLLSGISLGVEAMRREVQARGEACDVDNFRYVVEAISGDPDSIPEAVAISLRTGHYHGGSIEPEDFDTDHGGRTLADWMQLPQVVDADLSEAEFVAVRFYTSSSFSKINGPLRNGIVPHPWAMVVYFLDSGIKKLRAVQAKQDPELFAGTTTLWRGMKNLTLDIDEFRRVGGTELAPMSTTSSEDVAKHYASSKVPLVFKYSVSGLRTGVSIRFCSLYPKEEEYLYPPLTYLSYQRDYEDDGMRIVVIEPVMS